ncbi:hypothetical protein [Streptococcus equinus]|nr:hypothetical protein [Streptococcus equinus]
MKNIRVLSETSTTFKEPQLLTEEMYLDYIEKNSTTELDQL